MDSKEESMDLSVDFEKERKKVKNIRKNYLKERLKIKLLEKQPKNLIFHITLFKVGSKKKNSIKHLKLYFHL